MIDCFFVSFDAKREMKKWCSKRQNQFNRNLIKFETELLFREGIDLWLSYANLLLNVLYHIVIEMKIRESCLQTGIFIYKPGILVTKQDFHLQMGSLGLQMGFSAYYSPWVTIYRDFKCDISELNYDF